VFKKKKLYWSYRLFLVCGKLDRRTIWRQLRLLVHALPEKTTNSNNVTLQAFRLYNQIKSILKCLMYIKELSKELANCHTRTMNKTRKN